MIYFIIIIATLGSVFLVQGGVFSELANQESDSVSKRRDLYQKSIENLITAIILIGVALIISCGYIIWLLDKYKG